MVDSSKPGQKKDKDSSLWTPRDFPPNNYTVEKIKRDRYKKIRQMEPTIQQVQCSTEAIAASVMEYIGESYLATHLLVESLEGDHLRSCDLIM